ncbi:MAG TPA: hypothetical protein VGH35_07720 [Gaiellaceae bacterium]|jgi:hypothetical protein
MATTPRDRKPEDVRQDIERERERLVIAVEDLRRDLHRVTNVKPLLRKVAIGIAAFSVAMIAVKIVRRSR